MSKALEDHLDPSNHLPDENHVNVKPEAYRFAHDLLSATFPTTGFQHISRSGLAGSALYLASVAVSGRDRVSQETIADQVGTTRMSIHTHINRIARLAINEADMTEYAGISNEVLHNIAQGKHVQQIITEDK